MTKYSQFNDAKPQSVYYTYIYERMEEFLRVTQYYIFFIFKLLTNNKIAYCNIIERYKYNIKDVIIWEKINQKDDVEFKLNFYFFIFEIKKVIK